MLTNPKADLLYKYVSTARMLGKVDVVELFDALDRETQRREGVTAHMGRPKVFEGDISAVLHLPPTKAAQVLGISLSTYYRRRREYESEES